MMKMVHQVSFGARLIPDGRKAGLDGVLSGKIKDASKVLSLVAEDEANGPGPGTT